MAHARLSLSCRRLMHTRTRISLLAAGAIDVRYFSPKVGYCSSRVGGGTHRNLTPPQPLDLHVPLPRAPLPLRPLPLSLSLSLLLLPDALSLEGLPALLRAALLLLKLDILVPEVGYFSTSKLNGVGTLGVSHMPQAPYTSSLRPHTLVA